MRSSAILTVDREALLQRFHRVQQASIEMCGSLQSEEYRLQPTEDVSPPWWNLGHTSWFFARNVLAAFGVPGCQRPVNSPLNGTVNRPVAIGAKKFTESVILAEMGTQLARHTGVDSRRDDLGGTPALWLALTQGDIDAYPEYTGTITRQILKSDPPD